MKKILTFRMEEESINLIEILSKEYETTKVRILENAIKNYALSKRFRKKDLLKFIGKISDKDLKKINEVICIY